VPDENEIYEEWSAATDRREVEERLYRAVSRHAAAVVLTKFPEGHRDLVHNIASAVMGELGTFRAESKFSTSVHRIALLKTYEALRATVCRRKVFDDTKIVVGGPEEEAENHDHGETAGHVYASTLPDAEARIAFEELFDQLSEEEAALLQYKSEGFSSEEIAAKINISQEAVDSRWARLKKKLPLRDG